MRLACSLSQWIDSFLYSSASTNIRRITFDALSRSCWLLLVVLHMLKLPFGLWRRAKPSSLHHGRHCGRFWLYFKDGICGRLPKRLVVFLQDEDTVAWQWDSASLRKELNSEYLLTSSQDRYCIYRDDPVGAAESWSLSCRVGFHAIDPGQSWSCY